MTSTPSSPWRITKARVIVSLTPQKFKNGGIVARRAATKNAMKSFLMRYNKSLRGVPLAIHGPVRFPDNSVRHNAASPFSHVTAEVKALLFAPMPGCVLTGKVVHVGPDHIGLNVLGEFHAYIEVSNFYGEYAYKTFQDKSARRREFCWQFTGHNRLSENRPIVRKGTWIKFSVVQVLPAKMDGLFTIAGTVFAENEEELGLGFCDPLPESVETDMTQNNQDDDVTPELNSNAVDESVFADDTAQFNDDLAHLIDDSEQAPLELGTVRELENKIAGKKRRNLTDSHRRRERRRLNESPLGDVDLRDEDQAHLRAPMDDSPLGAQIPETINPVNTNNTSVRRASVRDFSTSQSLEITAGN